MRGCPFNSIIKTLRTENSINIFMNKIEKLVTSEKWFDNGM